MELNEIELINNKNEKETLANYKGKVILIVNTATKCGFTPQYEELEELYEKYKDEGFVILDFPCNQFFHQAPGSDEEIHEFCTLRYNTKFPRFAKIDVNGKNEHPLYKELKEKFPGRIKWNFTKFLINRKGEVVARYEPNKKPKSFEEDIKNLLLQR